MKNLTLQRITEACKGELFHFDSSSDREVSGVVLDSRQVEENFLFVATKGERVDGHDFIAQVMEKGAAGVVCEKAPEPVNGPYILVKDSFQALKDIAEFYRKQLTIKVIGVTGSVGKTSTKEFIASVLSVKYKVLKTEGNYNNEVGLPLTVLKIRDHHEAAVLEMGISDFGEMHRLSKVARPDLCVLTNIGDCHLENLKSREGVLRAKTEIFDFMNEEGVVCLNGDDAMLRTVEKVKGKKPFFFGRSSSNDMYADKLENKGLFGSSAVIHMEEGELTVDIPLPGEHMLYNALAAAYVGILCGLTKEEICTGIAEVKPVGGRSHIIRLENRVVIDDCYNANPVSMCSALDLLSSALTRKVAILGDMFELGENKEKMHEKVGHYAVEKGIDVIICIGELSVHMYENACKTLEESEDKSIQIHYFPDKKAFFGKISSILQAKDTVLVKASHGMAFEEIVKELEND